MSTEMRVTIAIAAILCSVAFVALGVMFGQVLPAGPLPMYGLAAFCFVMAVACIDTNSRPITIRIIGITIFLVCAGGLFMNPRGANILRALEGFFVIGLPFGYMAITGNYPQWGRASEAFNSSGSNPSTSTEGHPKSSSINHGGDTTQQIQ